MDYSEEDGTLIQSLSGLNFRFNKRRRVWCPPTDLYETDDSFIIKLEVAGMTEEDFSITFANGTLFVGGVRPEPKEKIGYHQMEISFGEFASEVRIQVPIKREEIDASYTNGFLTVTMPKVNKRQKVQVQS